jgi:hypothetical protein
MTHSEMISVSKLLCADTAISSHEGKALFAEIDSALSKGIRVSLDFSGIQAITAVFFNEAIGQLCDRYNPEQLRENLTVQHLDESDEHLLSQVIRRAYECRRDPQRIALALKDAFDDE